jgi:hypothetical protein
MEMSGQGLMIFRALDPGLDPLVLAQGDVDLALVTTSSPAW